MKKNTLLCEVLSMCHHISNKSKADVFFEYSPHCDSYTVCFYRNGWTNKTAGDMEYMNCVTKITCNNLKLTRAKLVTLAIELGVL